MQLEKIILLISYIIMFFIIALCIADFAIRLPLYLVTFGLWTIVNSLLNKVEEIKNNNN